jgi:hypothetical protein
MSAQTDALERARALATLMVSDELVRALRAQFVQAVVEATVAERKTNGMPDVSPADLQRVQALVVEAHNELIPPATFRQIFTDIYLKHFTAEELDAILTFFESPVGRKVRGTQTVLMQEGIAAGQALAQTHAPEIRRRIVERAQALDAETAARTGQPTSASSWTPAASLSTPPTKIKDVPPIYPALALAADDSGDGGRHRGSALRRVGPGEPAD